MNLPPILRYKIAIDNTPWWWKVAYLIIPWLDKFDQSAIAGLEQIARGKDRVFNSIIEKHVSAYLENGTRPPEAIAGPILNIAEDVSAGRVPTLRAGDYIALQTFRRTIKEH